MINNYHFLPCSWILHSIATLLRPVLDLIFFTHTGSAPCSMLQLVKLIFGSKLFQVMESMQVNLYRLSIGN